MLLLNPRRTRTNMKLLQLVWIFLLTLCGQSGITAMTVKEDDDVILNCSIGTTSIENKKFDWKKNVDQEGTAVFLYANNKPQPGQQFVNRVTHFPEQLQFGNASIKITKVQTKDNGTYTCYYITEARIPLPVIQATVSLTVGAAPKPSVTILDQPQNSALLQCEVLGAFPKPEVVWMDSDGMFVVADEPKVTKREGNKFDTVLNVTVTKTDHYTCVATQKEINHQNNRTIFVRLNGGASEPYISILGGTKDGVLLQCVVRGASPELKVFFTDKSGNLVPSKEPQKTENSIILQTTVTKTDDYRCVTTEGKKDDELYSETHVVVPDGASNGLMFGLFVLGFILGPLVVGTIGVFLWFRYKKRAGGSTPITSRQQQQRRNSLTDVQPYLFTSA